MRNADKSAKFPTLEIFTSDVKEAFDLFSNRMGFNEEDHIPEQRLLLLMILKESIDFFLAEEWENIMESEEYPDVNWLMACCLMHIMSDGEAEPVIEH